MAKLLSPSGGYLLDSVGEYIVMPDVALTVAATTQAQTISAVVLQPTPVAAATVQAQTISPVTLIQNYVLAVKNTVQNQMTSAVALTSAVIEAYGEFTSGRPLAAITCGTPGAAFTSSAPYIVFTSRVENHG